MNIKKTLVAFAVVLSLVFCFAGCTGGNLSPKSKTVAVITKGSDSDFWNDVKNGAFSAATEYNIDITFEGPDSEEDYESQNKMIENAVSKNVGAIVLSAIDYEKNALAVQKAIDKGIKVITVDSDVDANGKELFIGTDNVSAGKKAAEQAIELCKNKKSVNIGIVNYGENTENGKQRLKGFTDYIDKVKNAKVVASVNVESNAENATLGAKQLIEENKGINVLIGFNEWSTLGVGYAIKELNLKDEVFGIGFDSNVNCVGMLETGEIDTLIVQNPFSMGYLSVSKAAELLLGNAKTDGVIETDTYVVNRKNMFSPDVQKILFSFNNENN
ncbi:substrate-binding domain-containing protein [uncultured Eubacterium sp.]|uniref:substrate-binding domain-containing protein n=1 Tax=uncultured Eubacterium sp. TaxID=165185 RepID=UPI0025E8BB01|nr:substrate-binding domain-containing protein [uncultured Eubacterium sp.]